MKVLTIRR